jgi:hypothetical protein
MFCLRTALSIWLAINPGLYCWFFFNEEAVMFYWSLWEPWKGLVGVYWVVDCPSTQCKLYFLSDGLPAAVEWAAGFLDVFRR